MAEFTLPAFTTSTGFSNTTGNLIGDVTFGNTGLISDGDAGDPDFQAGEAITIAFMPGILVLDGTYLGFVTVDGTDYPVFEFDNNTTQVLGVELDPATFPDLGSLGLTTGSFTACFLAGTKIATPTGYVPVEDLRIGDCATTADGRAVEIKWIGRKTVTARFGPAERLHPVCICAGALGNNTPNADLFVTADHALLIDSVLCHAGALVNGTTITRDPMNNRFTVYHVETEAHEIILANGAPAETFIANAGRRAFDNFAEFDALYGDVPEMPELPFPRAVSARQLPARLRRRVA